MKVFLITVLIMANGYAYSQYNVQVDVPDDSLNQTNLSGLRQGLWVEFCDFHSNSSYYGHLIGNYSNGTKNGLWQFFYKDELRAEGYFKEDKLEGGVYVYIKGKIRYHMNFATDQLEGDSRVFSKQGRLLGIYTYHKDRLINVSCFEHKKCKKIHEDLKKKVPSFYSG